MLDDQTYHIFVAKLQIDGGFEEVIFMIMLL